MRYRALLEATKDAEFRERIGTKKAGEVPASWVLDASEFTEEQRRRFVIVDNAPDGMSGEWDWDVLANEWGDVDLCDLGMDVPGFEEEKQTQKNDTKLNSFFKVVIVCDSEAQMEMILEEMQSRGLECQSLIY